MTHFNQPTLQRNTLLGGQAGYRNQERPVEGPRVTVAIDLVEASDSPQSGTTIPCGVNHSSHQSHLYPSPRSSKRIKNLSSLWATRSMWHQVNNRGWTSRICAKTLNKYVPVAICGKSSLMCVGYGRDQFLRTCFTCVGRRTEPLVAAKVRTSVGRPKYIIRTKQFGALSRPTRPSASVLLGEQVMTKGGDCLYVHCSGLRPF